MSVFVKGHPFDITGKGPREGAGIKTAHFAFLFERDKDHGTERDAFIRGNNGNLRRIYD